jgi:hypothetical protein
MPRQLLGSLAFLALTAALAGCGGDDGGSGRELPAPYDPGTAYVPVVTAAELSNDITNELFPAPVGARWVYEATTDEGVEHIEVTVLADEKQVWGASVRVVRDTVWVADEMVEDTWDWYAQDPDGHVWYMGEETYEYEGGVVVCECGAWESGVDGALPGVVMLADPQVGDTYRQEFYEGEAEDYAEVVSLDATVDVPAGSFTGCLETRDRSAIDPELDERKFYCPGVGNTLVIEGDVRVELIEYSGL